jgi:hypothetical protein
MDTQRPLGGPWVAFMEASGVQVPGHMRASGEAPRYPGGVL